jgi:hypothetical protein
MKIIAFIERKTIFTGILLSNISVTADKSSNAKENTFLQIKLAMIYAMAIISFILGSSLCMTEFDG